MTITNISYVTIYVADQAKALSWYKDKLGFQVVEDNTELVPGFRWLTISPQGNDSVKFVLMPPRDPGDEQKIGNNNMCVLATDNCKQDCEEFKSSGVKIVDEPTVVPWGVSAIIHDLYGNPYNLVEAK